jgi:hypothetical protein
MKSMYSGLSIATFALMGALCIWNLGIGLFTGELLVGGRHNAHFSSFAEAPVGYALSLALSVFVALISIFGVVGSIKGRKREREVDVKARTAPAIDKAIRRTLDER